MEWSDEGVILGVRPHGETGAVLELFTRAHGRHLGLVHGGRSRKLRPVLQTGNHVDATWKARLADNLGHFALELQEGLRGPGHGRCRGPGRAHLDRRADPPPARARSPSQPLRGDAVRAGLPRRARGVAGPGRALGAGAAGGAGLRPRSRLLRGDGQDHRPRLRLAQVGPRRVGRGRRALQGAPAGAAGVPARRRHRRRDARKTCAPASRSPGISSTRACCAPATWRCPTRAPACCRILGGIPPV